MDPLWVDKYRPRSLQRLSFHPQVAEVLNQLADSNDFPHLILYGPQGSGKTTRAYSFLSKLFGQNVYKIKEQQRSIKPQNSTTQIQFNLFSSNYHIQMTPADNDNNDRHIIQNVVKQIAANSNVQSKSGKGFKVLIIKQADKLTKDAQGALRRTMEKYIKNCRMILLCNNLHKLINPIRSRCLNIRVSAPSVDSIEQVLKQISKIQGPNLGNFHFNNQTISNIAKNCGRNLRHAIIQLQASKYTKNTQGMLSPYKETINQIYTMMNAQQNPQQLKQIRNRLYDLLVNCIDGQAILKQLLQVIVNKTDMRQQYLKEVIHQAAQHEKTLLCGSKAIYHLQSFVAHVMQQIMINKNNKMIIQ